ncbi:hypothetical protein [uncultured Lactobacillus sp.]|uniref:hypothetical protein n=1 Tax=uncultured Lactobacillus sp. TaxID=153152 RepID=UPI0025D83840|nr:hypothetical protein [uncultured Lactobacillus sp.]
MNNQSYVISSLAGNMAVQISNLNIQLAQEQAKNKELTDRNENLQKTIEELRKEAKKNESSGHNPAHKQN